MGQPKKIKKSYSRPLKRWDMTRLEEEGNIKEKYGLRNKREIWRAQGILRTFRRNARHILSLPADEAEKRKMELVHKLSHLGLIQKTSTLDDVLGLKIEDLLNRRLQTIVFRKGYAQTVKQARQIIVHGHVTIDGRVNNSPGTLIPADTESKIKVGANFKVIEEGTKTPKEHVAEKKQNQPKQAEEKKVAA